MQLKRDEKGYIYINNYTTHFCLKCYKYIIYINNPSNNICPSCYYDKIQNVFYSEAKIYFEQYQRYIVKNYPIVKEYYYSEKIIKNNNE